MPDRLVRHGCARKSSADRHPAERMGFKGSLCRQTRYRFRSFRLPAALSAPCGGAWRLSTTPCRLADLRPDSERHHYGKSMTRGASAGIEERGTVGADWSVKSCPPKRARRSWQNHAGLLRAPRRAPGSPFLTFAALWCKHGSKCQNLKDHYQQYDSSGFQDFDICGRAIVLTRCKSQNESTSWASRAVRSSVHLRIARLCAQSVCVAPEHRFRRRLRSARAGWRLGPRSLLL